MFILSDGEGKNVTIELMEPVCLSINSVYIYLCSMYMYICMYSMHVHFNFRVNSSSCFGLLLMFLILGVDV